MKYLLSAWIGIIFMLVWYTIPEAQPLLIGFLAAMVLLLLFYKAEESF